ncbi:MAG: DUF1003 domain-containing protein [Taibaiella sp.]|nr:DUF1003 domain-containing protein [Taibaiella sp.]
MEQKCIIRGEHFNEVDGVLWKHLRPSIQQYLRTLNDQWPEESFISYKALNDLLRAYVTDMASQQIREQQTLAKKVQDRFANDNTLKPLLHDLPQSELTFGEKLSDQIAEFGGSWTFITIFFVVLVGWMFLNALILRGNAFDPFPFIFLNLVLSCLAAIQAPIIMMSQNRQGIKDRLQSEYDFRVNLKAETEVRILHEKLDHLLLHQHRNMSELFQLQVDVMQQLQMRLDSMSAANTPPDAIKP